MKVFLLVSIYAVRTVSVNLPDHPGSPLVVSNALRNIRKELNAKRTILDKSLYIEITAGRFYFFRDTAKYPERYPLPCKRQMTEYSIINNKTLWCAHWILCGAYNFSAGQFKDAFCYFRYLWTSFVNLRFTRGFQNAMISGRLAPRLEHYLCTRFLEVNIEDFFCGVAGPEWSRA